MLTNAFLHHYLLRRGLTPGVEKLFYTRPELCQMHRLTEIGRCAGAEHINLHLLITECRYDDNGTIRDDRSQAIDIVDTTRCQTNLGNNQIRHSPENR